MSKQNWWMGWGMWLFVLITWIWLIGIIAPDIPNEWKEW